MIDWDPLDVDVGVATLIDQGFSVLDVLQSAQWMLTTRGFPEFSIKIMTDRRTRVIEARLRIPRDWRSLWRVR